MFHKNALIVNGILLSLCIFICLWTDFQLLLNYLKYSGIIWLVVYFLLFYVFSLIFLFFIIAICNVKIGKPPIGSLVVAYKFGYSNKLTSSDVNQVDNLFPTYDKVQICYERKLRSFGIAHGAILRYSLEDMSDESKAYTARHGYRIFHFGSVPNALYISCPNIPWLPYIGVWLVLSIAYPKLYKYSKQRRLSAYPVMEVYRRFSVLLMAPLSHQDNFVVPEAQCIVQRSSSSLNSSVISSVNVSPISSRHSRSCSTSFHGFSTTKDDVVGITKLDSVKTMPVKLVNGITKQG